MKNFRKLERFIAEKNLPILILDFRWHQLFSDDDKPSEIEKLEDELSALLKLQGKISGEIKELSTLKKNLLQEIIINMEETIESEEAFRQKKLAKTRRVIKEINFKLEKLEDDYEIIPELITEKNNELLIAGLQSFYYRIKANEKDLEELEDFIEKTRRELKRKVILKEEKEEMNSRIYSYMHDILGAEYMEFFDSSYGV